MSLQIFSLLVFSLPVALFAQTNPTAGPRPIAGAPDYASPANWVCRPGHEEVCTTGLNAVLLEPNGKATPQPFQAAANPPIDCFYVYPTTSHEPTQYADMADSPEVQRTTKAQAGRLSSRCRVFAPIYRQLTSAGLRDIAGEPKRDWFGPPLEDVVAAWNYYLQHENQGRGVVLVGHSQGSILLQRLISGSIDGKPAQALLVAAFLAGDPLLEVKTGTRAGGTFAHISTCSSAEQVGCVYVWGSYRADDDVNPRVFGHGAHEGMVSACESPAAPAGGPGPLKTYQPAPLGGTTGAPWVETVGLLTGACRTDAQGSVLRITVEPGPEHEHLDALLRAARPGWGLHGFDIALVQGNILDDLDAELATWSKKQPIRAAVMPTD